MVASGLRQPYQIPHPPRRTKIQTVPMSKKAKGKAKEPPTTAPKRRVQVSTSEPSSGPSWGWTSLTDSVASNVPPIFTKDGSYFFSLVGCSVRIYAVSTGKIVSTLSSPRPTGHDASSDILTCAVLNPHNAFQLITGSLNGVLAVWDFLEATLLQLVDITQPIHHICVHENFKDSVFLTASRAGKKVDDNAIVLRVSLKPAESASQSTIQKSSEITPIGKIRYPTGLAFSPGGRWLVATAGHKAYVASTASPSSGFTKYVSPERLTCLAFHPTEDYFATGDDKGNIRLWYCLHDQSSVKPVGVEKKTQTTALHWHAHAVSSIAFTSNGAYLLSGGEESVLVVWQLHTGKREFLPRIGSPIKTITVCKLNSGEEEYLLGLADATYTFVASASLKVSRSYSRIKLDPSTSPSTSKTSPIPLSVHGPTSTLILPSSHRTSLQIYSPSSLTLVSELEVSPSNRVSRRDDKSIEPCRVERTTISPSGDWMATVDVREGDESAHGESYLKIWRWDRKTGFWILNTRVDRPHGLERVVHAAFSPSSDGRSVLLTTIGGDCAVKTFRIHVAKNKSGLSEEFWVARSTLPFHNETPSHLSWSADGSLLAISLRNRVVLLDPSTNLSRHSVSLPEFGPIHGAYLIGKTGRYLAAVSATDLMLWDLIEQRVRWHHKSSSFIHKLVSHPRDDTFVIVSTVAETSNESKILLFQANSSQPAQTLSMPFGFRNVVWYPFVSSHFSLVGITHDWKIVVFGESVSAVPEEGSVSRELTSHSLPQHRTLFQDIFGKSAFDGPAVANSPPSVASSSRPWTGRESAGLFEHPAYLMPPLENLFEPLMSSVLKLRVTEPSLSRPISPNIEDVSMEGDEPIFAAGADGRRVVDAIEMETMVELFRTHTLKVKTPTAGEATRKRNGLTNGRVNGASPPSKQIAAMATPSAKLAGNFPVPAAPTPLVNGKKRKKSLD